MTTTTPGPSGAPSRIEGYAAGLLEIAKAEGQLDRTVDELYRFARAVEQNDELRSTLTEQTIPAEKRQAIVEDILGQRISPIGAAMVSFIVGAGRARDLVAIADRLGERSAGEREHELAEVRSAMPLDDEERQRLEDALSKALGKQIEVKVIVDPSVMGGLIAKVGDTVIDGSVRHRLERLREAM